jgi:hypothetical protein
MNTSDGITVWASRVPKLNRTCRYPYVLDGQRWENAWQDDGSVPNPYGNDDSVIVIE